MIKKALCIGNSAYSGDPLKNAANDAVSISSRLEVLGFSCMLLKDATNENMGNSINTFCTGLKDSDVGLFFFAGHGMQIEGENFLTAVDTNFFDESSAKYSSQNLSRIIDVLEKGDNATSILILDACRNNPFERKWRGVGSRGLAPVYAPKGTIIAFATSPGQVALDGNGDNGKFTSALLRHIDTQNLTIEDLLKRVRNTLSSSTNGRQTSWEHTSLMGDFFFNTSILTGEYIAEYSKEANADILFDTSGARPIYEIIRKLKSHNWPTQNPAISLIEPTALLGADKDSLFVLGRNLYQSACGGSYAAQEVLSNIGSFLDKYEKEVSFHILNGMLFEVYFDSNGRFRENKKTEQLEMLLILEENVDFAKSFEFIRQALLSYQKELFYLPGICRDVVINVNLSSSQTVKNKIENIMFEGHDIFYTDDGISLILNTIDIPCRVESVNWFESDALEKMVLPRKRCRITYLPAPPDGDFLYLPHEYSIRRVGG